MLAILSHEQGLIGPPETIRKPDCREASSNVYLFIILQTRIARSRTIPDTGSISNCCSGFDVGGRTGYDGLIRTRAPRLPLRWVRTW